MQHLGEVLVLVGPLHVGHVQTDDAQVLREKFGPWLGMLDATILDRSALSGAFRAKVRLP
jgi:hypothetical protein